MNGEGSIKQLLHSRVSRQHLGAEEKNPDLEDQEAEGVV
jgi:hypothetical protein